MKLEDIGFYTLSDERAKNSSVSSPLHRCELLLTNRCNFNCLYCRGLKGKDISLEEAKRILHYWFSEGLKNIRFSGGEPTLYDELPYLVHLCKINNVEHIAISTNGSADICLYKHLIYMGVNDISISLDACCASTGEIMSGVKDVWQKVIKNIECLSSMTYVTAGVVVNEKNKEEINDIIILANNLGVADIRIISSAQYNRKIYSTLPQEIINKFPILKYRMSGKRNIRGMNLNDTGFCKLSLDDMAVWEGKHYPCIIYLRENGNPIGEISKKTRAERLIWAIMHESHNDNICRNNCLDVCISYNNRAMELFHNSLKEN